MDLSDPDDEMDDGDSETSETRISKPSGEPGRPKCGGHNLVESLSGWPSAFVEEVKAYVRDLASKHLNENVSYIKQDKEKVRVVCEEAKEKFPILDKYAGHWPVIDILKARLKYTAQRYNQQIKVNANSKAEVGSDRSEDEDDDDDDEVPMQSVKAVKQPARAVKKPTRAAKQPAKKSGGRALRNARS